MIHRNVWESLISPVRRTATREGILSVKSTHREPIAQSRNGTQARLQALARQLREQ
jgi:hypothetical protein